MDDDRVQRRMPMRQPPRQPIRHQPRRRPMPREEYYEELPEDKEYIDDTQQSQINYLINQMKELKQTFEHMGSQQMAEIRDVKKSESAFITEEAIQKYESILAEGLETIKTIEKTGTKEDLSQKTQEFWDELLKNKRETALKIGENIIARYEDIREHYIRLISNLGKYTTLLKDNYGRARDMSEFTKPLFEKSTEELKKKLVESINDLTEDMKPDREIITREQEEVIKKQEELQSHIEKKNREIEELINATKKEFIEKFPNIVKELTEAMKKEIQNETVKSIRAIREINEKREREEISRLKEIVEELRQEQEDLRRIEAKVEDVLEEDEEEEEEKERDRKSVRVRSGKKLPKEETKHDHDKIKEVVGEYEDKPKKRPHEDLIDPETGEYMV